MRGKASPAPRVFESPYSTTILPAKDAGRAPKGAAAPAASAPAPAAEVAPAYIPTHAPVAAPIAAAEPMYAPPSAAFTAPATDYPVQYPSAPGFPPQPQYAATAQLADPAPFAPVAPPAPAAPASVGYPSASYQPAYQPTPYQPAAYAPPTNPPSSYQPNRFEPQGYAAPGYAAPGYAAPGQAQPFQNFPPTSGRSAGAKVLIGLATVVVGFVVLGILAAIAIPVFLSQREKTANRNVALPATLVDQQRVSSPDLDAAVASEVTNMQQHIPGITQTQASFYGQGSLPIFLVVAGKLARQATSADVKAFFSTTGTASDPTMTPVGSGPFGGSMECGPSILNGEAFEICGSIDNAAAVYVLAANTTSSQLAALTREILSGIEQKG